jgi:hypothetical protein
VFSRFIHSLICPASRYGPVSALLGNDGHSIHDLSASGHHESEILDSRTEFLENLEPLFPADSGGMSSAHSPMIFSPFDPPSFSQDTSSGVEDHAKASDVYASAYLESPPQFVQMAELERSPREQFCDPLPQEYASLQVQIELMAQENISTGKSPIAASHSGDDSADLEADYSGQSESGNSDEFTTPASYGGKEWYTSRYADGSLGDDLSTSEPARRIRGSNIPIPVPNLTKKSRGRPVPTSSSLVSAGGTKKTDRKYKCTAEGCEKCFIRSEHLKRHLRSIHTNEKRT